MSIPDGETVPVRRESSDDAVQSSLELRIRYADRPREVVPLNRAAVDHPIDGTLLRFACDGQRVRFRCLSPSARVYKDGQAVDEGLLEVGASLEVGSHRVFLWDAGNPVAYLKGYSAPYSNEIWPLSPGRHPIGRAGKRRNAVQLDHPTVSRQHATIIAGDDGSYRLLAESGTNPVFLRGEAVEPGATRELCHGDLLELGALVLRFHQPERAPAASEDDASVQVRSLGGFAVQVGGVTLPDRAWKTQYVKWMFAHLAYNWEKPLGTEALMEELWPDSDPKNARNNFNYSLSTVRKALRSVMPESLQGTEIVLRSSSTLQLNPDLLDRHDAVTLQRLAASHPAESADWEPAAEAGVLSYAGPFLPECYLDWADAVRQTLEIHVMELARTLLTRLEQREAWDRAISVGSHVLGINRHAQWACLHVMRAMSRSGRAPEALRLFDGSRALWMAELGQEPEIELLREQQRILTLL